MKVPIYRSIFSDNVSFFPLERTETRGSIGLKREREYHKPSLWKY